MIFSKYNLEKSNQLKNPDYIFIYIDIPESIFVRMTSFKKLKISKNSFSRS